MLPATDWQEHIDAGEAESFEAYAEQLRALQRKNASGSQPSRALHAKGQLGVEAGFTVLPDLPEHARVGVFAASASYRAYVRFSNGQGKRRSDAKPDVRGIAVKLLGVAGAKIIPGMEQAPTQDFLCIHTPATPVRNADEFIGLVRAASAPLTGGPHLARQLGVSRLRKVAAHGRKSLSRPIPSLATTRYYSALPIQFGRYAVHYALTPHAPADVAARRNKGADYLGQELAARLREGTVTYDFQVQFYVDEERTPIEDASVEWRESDAPFLTVALLTLNQQDTASPRGQRVGEFIERLSFDPWHALVEFRPLGNMMRARSVAYRVSTQERRAAPEPDGSEHFD